MVHVKPHIGNKLYISSSWFHPLHITLEFLEFVLNVYFQSGVYRFAVVTQNLEPLRKAIKVGNKMAYPKVHSGPFGKSKQGECPFCGTQIFSCLFPSLLFLDTISCLMEIKHSMRLCQVWEAFVQPSRPSPFWTYFSASSHNPTRWITTSIPMNAVTFRLHWEPELFHWGMIPLGKRQKSSSTESAAVQAALLPPWRWHRVLVPCTSRSSTFPFPSWSHCPPSTMVARFPPGCSLGRPQSSWTRRMPPGWSWQTPRLQRHEKSPKGSGVAGSVWTGLLCKFMFESLNIKYNIY